MSITSASRRAGAAALPILRRIGGAFRRPFSSEPDPASSPGYHVAGGPSFMRGAVFWEPGRPLTLEDFRMPRPKAGELLIKTKGRIIAAIYRLLLLRFFVSLFVSSNY